MKIILAFLVLSVVCLSNETNHVVTLSGKAFSSNGTAIKSGTVFVQPWSYRKNIDSCQIDTNGGFTISLKKNCTYNLVFRTSSNQEYYKTVFLWENCSIAVFMPPLKSNDVVIKFANDSSFTSKINRAGDKLKKQLDVNRNTENKKSDWRSYKQVYDSLISANADSVFIQQYLMSQILDCSFFRNFSIEDSGKIRELFNIIPPASPLWSFANSALFVYLDATNSFDYCERVINSQSDRWTKGWLMLYYLPMGVSRSDSLRVRAYAQQIIEEFNGTEMAAMAKTFASKNSQSEYDLRGSQLEAGMKLPDFTFPLLNNHSSSISNKDLLGKTYLLSFWATWCKPCIEQMSYIDSAYKKYHAKGLEIISVTVDKDLSKVLTFRKKWYSMPWQNVFAPDELNNIYLKKIVVLGIPTEFLVDGKGIIIATNKDLLKDKLYQTLDKTLRK